jgi:hypothetical protein
VRRSIGHQEPSRAGKNIGLKVSDDLDLSTFGIPWGFKYGQLQATNTCGLDTALMCTFFLHKYSGITEAASDGTLGTVLSLIEKEEYARARFVWCTEKLKEYKYEDLIWDLYTSVEDLFRDVCPFLFQLKWTRSSMCSSSFCPERAIMDSMEGDHWARACPALNGLVKQITLEVLDDEWVGPMMAPCNKRLPIGSQPEIPDKFRQVVEVSLLDSDDEGVDVPGGSWECRGMRLLGEKQILEYPPLLDIAVAVSETDPMRTKPVQMLVLGKYEYDLVAVIYTSEARNHFFAHILLQNHQPLFYDGMLKPVLRWQTVPAYNQTTFPISRLWYKKSRLREEGTTQLQSLQQEEHACSSSSSISSATAVLKEARHPAVQIKIESPPSNQGSIIDKDVEQQTPPVQSFKEQLLEIVQGKKKMKTRARRKTLFTKKKAQYPTGLSIQKVAAKGKIPECAGCHQSLQRGEQRLVNRSVCNEDKQWYSNVSYHLKTECLQTTLSVSEKQQLQELVHADNMLKNLHF